MSKTMTLFGKLGAAYGYLWQNQYSDPDMMKFAVNLWEKKIEKFENFELSFGFEKCINSLEFPPTLSQFVKKCAVEPKDVGFLPWQQSFIEQDKVYETIKKNVGSWNWQRMSDEQQRKEFKIRYEIFTSNYLISINSDKKEKLSFVKQILLPQENKNA